MTEAEAVVWAAVRRGQVGCRIRRQVPIGPFVVDFVCLRHRWIWELDGSQHFESRYDQGRTAWLEAHGFTVMRFWNNQVLGDMETVTDTIAAHAQG